MLSEETGYFDMKVLDIGCGTNPQKDANYRVDYVKTQETTHVVNIDLDVLPFKDNFFDKIYCLHVLEHLNNIEHAMKEIHRCLIPGGFAIIEVPYFRSPISKNPLHKTEWGYDAFNYWTEKNRRMVLKGHSSFKMIERRFIFDRSMNLFIERICRWIIDVNPYLYQNIFGVFFSARALRVKLRKD